MDPHRIELSREIIIGNDAFSQLPEILEKLELKGPALLISGPTTFDVAGGEIENILEKRGFTVEREITSQVTRDELDRIKEEAGRSRFVLGVGGGRIIDTAKYIGTERGVPFISVPTAPSHDGIASSRATINDKERRYSYQADAPSVILADLETIKQAPEKLITAGCGDLVSNITAVEDWKLGERENNEYYSDYAAALSVLSAEIVMNSANLIRERKERGIRNLIKALISAGISMSIAGSSRPCSGAEHQFSHALDHIAEKPGLHGHQCAIGTLLSARLHDMDWRSLKESMKELGIPLSIQDQPFTEEEAIKAWKDAGSIRDRYTILDEKGAGNPKSLFKEVGII
ncbi:MAG: iron-containing alcohol dehydrogenase [Candidatus Aenigmatarchaeota archaeon]